MSKYFFKNCLQILPVILIEFKWIKQLLSPPNHQKTWFKGEYKLINSLKFA